jgi:hypothetical protein
MVALCCADCIQNCTVPFYLLLFSAGNEDAALALASAAFAPAALTRAESGSLMRRAFSRHAAGLSVPCQVTSIRSSCNGAASLLAVPGLLVKTMPGKSLSIRTNSSCPISGLLTTVMHRVLTELIFRKAKGFLKIFEFCRLYDITNYAYDKYYTKHVTGINAVMSLKMGNMLKLSILIHHLIIMFNQ